MVGTWRTRLVSRVVLKCELAVYLQGGLGKESAGLYLQQVLIQGRSTLINYQPLSDVPLRSPEITSSVVSRAHLCCLSRTHTGKFTQGGAYPGRSQDAGRQDNECNGGRGQSRRKPCRGWDGSSRGGQGYGPRPACRAIAG